MEGVELGEMEAWGLLGASCLAEVGVGGGCLAGVFWGGAVRTVTE